MMKCIMRFIAIGFLAALVSTEASAIAPFMIGGHAVTNPQIVVVAQGNPKTLLLDSLSDGIQTHLYKLGIQASNFSEITFKKDNEFSYGLYGDIIFGEYFLKQYEERGLYLPKVQKNGFLGTYNQYTAKAAANFIAYFVETHKPEYVFVRDSSLLHDYIEVPAKDAFTYNKEDNTYSATVRARFYKDKVMYEEYVHVLAYEDPYRGAAVRFLAFASYDDATLWPANRNILQP